MQQDNDQNPMRPLIVHFGVQKTGTTSLQRFLKLNADSIADQLIIRTPEEGTPMRPLGRAAIAASLGDSDDLRKALRVAFEDVLDTIPDGPQGVLLSHENLAGAMPGNAGVTRLFPALPRLLKVLDTVAHARGFDPHYVFYTRKMDAWKSSVWAQAVRTDGYSDTRDAFLAQVADLPGWGDLERRLTKVLGKDRVTRLMLGAETHPDRPGQQLLALAGMPAARINALPPLQGRAMERLNDGSTEFLRRLNGLALNPHARGKVVDLVSQSQTLFTADMPSEGTL
ncbi:hypothetical protein [Paracoccus sp. JM45]|uniref:hypothetical protein n=1 Tax=Paracoccus sp. JM45 TaxID=2283626 RepID=UPI000E6C507D|nr:hypothetical protein [Paracoccus sp. JM45]RJE81354.1 hypothetical protein DWB67_01510 [Paracoccus sp. JM45]